MRWSGLTVRVGTCVCSTYTALGLGCCTMPRKLGGGTCRDCWVHDSLAFYVSGAKVMQAALHLALRRVLQRCQRRHCRAELDDCRFRRFLRVSSSSSRRLLQQQRRRGRELVNSCINLLVLIPMAISNAQFLSSVSRDYSTAVAMPCFTAGFQPGFPFWLPGHLLLYSRSATLCQRISLFPTPKSGNIFKSSCDNRGEMCAAWSVQCSSLHLHRNAGGV